MPPVRVIAVLLGIRFDQPGLSEHTLDGRFAEYVAGQLGVGPRGITWRDTTCATRESDLTSGAVDLMVASGQDLVLRRSDTTITGPETLNGRRLCSVTGSTSAQVVGEPFSAERYDSGRWPDSVHATIGRSGYPIPAPPVVTER